MQELKDILRQQHERRAPHDDPLVEALMGEILMLAEDVCVLRDRLETCQRLAAAGAEADDAAIDAYEIDDAQRDARLKRHRAFFEALFARIGT